MSEQVLLCTLRTRVIEDHAQPVTEGGFFECHVYALDQDIITSGSPSTFIAKTIGMHLASSILDTQVPREMWYAEFPEDIQRKFNYPKQVAF